MGSLQNIISTAKGIKNVDNSDLKNPKQWLLNNWGISNDSGIRVSEKTALACMAYQRGVDLLAGHIATQPKHLYRRTSTRGKEVARDHSLHQLISRRPNLYQNSYQFHYYLVVNLIMRGNFYAYINRNSFYEPVSLIPIAPFMVEPKIQKNRKVFKIDGAKRLYTNNEILHVYGMALDGVKGINPIKYASQTLGLGLAAEKMQSSAFGKGLHAGGVITMPEEHKGLMGSTDEEADSYMKAVRESFRKIYQNGPDSWHEVMFLEPGWAFKQFELNLETAKIIETRKFGVADIARLLGVPLHKLMDLDKATMTNIEQQGIEYVQDGILPRTINIEHEFCSKLLKEDEQNEYFIKYNVDGLMRASLKDRYEAYSIALGKNAPGFMSPGEIRDLEDLGEKNESELFKPDNMNKQDYVAA